MLNRTPSLLFFLILFPLVSYAQSGKTDSLKNVLRSKNCDTCVAEAYIELASVYRKQNVADTARQFAEEGLKRSKELHYRRGFAKASYQLAVLTAMKGDPVGALRLLETAEPILDSLHETKIQASVLQAISVQKVALGDYVSALESSYKSIELKQSLGDSAAMSTAYSTLAHIYNSNQEYPKAVIAYQQSARIDSLEGNDKELANDYGNIGTMLMNDHQDSLGMYFLLKSIGMHDKLGEFKENAYAYNTIGSSLFYAKRYEEALHYHEMATEIAKTANDQRLNAYSHLFIGRVYGALNRVNEAESEMLLSVQLAEEMNSSEILILAYDGLTNFYESQNRPADALKYLRLYFARKDSLYSESKRDEMTRKELNYTYEKQRDLDQAEQDKQTALYEEDKKAKKFFIYGIASFTILTLVFLIFVYSRFRVSQRQKALIALQKAEVEMQHHEIEEKNKDITDSINYASRIQAAILPDISEVHKSLGNSFVYYRPKDIVSGDFYWIAETDKYIFYATADCTGHGVPGGFMSMLGMALLNEVVIERKINEPGMIMDMGGIL